LQVGARVIGLGPRAMARAPSVYVSSETPLEPGANADRVRPGGRLG
jgi:hypothetical protein